MERPKIMGRAEYIAIGSIVMSVTNRFISPGLGQNADDYSYEDNIFTTIWRELSQTKQEQIVTLYVAHQLER